MIKIKNKDSRPSTAVHPNTLHKIQYLSGLLSITLLLCSCSNSSSSEIDKLKLQVMTLEQENRSLKERLNSQNNLLATKPKEEPIVVATSPETSTTANNIQNNNNDQLTSSSNNSAAQTNSQSTSTSASTPIHPQFSDIDDSSTKDMIEDLAKLGIFDGMNNTFKPYEKISRGDYITWLYKSINAILPESQHIRFAPDLEPQFKDLPPSHPAYKYAQALANAGYSVGYEDKTFKPDQAITREEMIGIKVGIDAGKEQPSPGDTKWYKNQMAFVWKFSDAQNIDLRYCRYIHDDYYISGPKGNNIQRAFGNIGTFKPKQAASRSQAAGTLWQIGKFGMQRGTAKIALGEAPTQ